MSRDRQPPAAAHGAIPATEACASLLVDLDAVRDNWRTAARLSGSAQCAAVVKGDAYGTGLEPVARALMDAGARTFFAATIGEARRVRACCGPSPVVYVLNGLLPDAGEAFREADLRPVLGSMPEIAEWRAHGGGKAAVHVDTGMNRLGIPLSELGAVAAEPGFEISLLLTHMACADEPGHPLNQRQRARFEEARAMLPGVNASLANSASIAWLRCAGEYDLSRPGIALYGGEPIEGHRNPFRPVVELVAPVLQVREVAARRDRRLRRRLDGAARCPHSGCRGGLCRRVPPGRGRGRWRGRLPRCHRRAARAARRARQHGHADHRRQRCRGC